MINWAAIDRYMLRKHNSNPLTEPERIMGERVDVRDYRNHTSKQVFTVQACAGRITVSELREIVPTVELPEE